MWGPGARSEACSAETVDCPVMGSGRYSASLSSVVLGVHPPLMTVTCSWLASMWLPPWGLGMAVLLGILEEGTPDFLGPWTCCGVHHVPPASTALAGHCP